ncbi:MAG: NifB/NifX family molybdenum-iron cluster-binding protein [Bacteroidota bacterium]
MNAEKSITIGILTDDGKTISSHFGRALYVEVITLEGNQVVGRERREKPGHHTFGGGGHQHRHGGDETERHGHGHGPAVKHAAMAEIMEGCQMVIARGMGPGAFENLSSRGMHPTLTDLHTIDEALLALGEGTLVHRPERIHHKGNRA